MLTEKDEERSCNLLAQFEAGKRGVTLFFSSRFMLHLSLLKNGCRL